MSERKAQVLGLAAFAVIAGGLGVGLFFLLREPDPEPVVEVTDSGMSDDEQVQLAIEIGYLQQGSDQ